MKTREVVSGIQGAWESVSTSLALVFSFTYRVGVEPWDLRGICNAWCTAALLVLPVSDSEKTCAWEDSELARAGLTVRPAGDRMT